MGSDDPITGVATTPSTRTLAPTFTDFARPGRMPTSYLVVDVSSTVTSTPVAVANVKPVADVASTMPVAPPGSGPDTGAVGGVAVGVAVAVAVAEGVAAAAADVTPTPARPAA